jgi:hypothetical protein
MGATLSVALERDIEPVVELRRLRSAPVMGLSQEGMGCMISDRPGRVLERMTSSGRSFQTDCR